MMRPYFFLLIGLAALSPTLLLGADGKVTPAKIQAARQGHWSYQPIADPKPPAVQNNAWVRNDIDRFVLAKLEANGLQPSPAADANTLVRRLHFNLIGLPPTPQQVTAFLQDKETTAYQKRVEMLLAHPGYGQRWGRHWLDVARYADTKGYVGDTADNRYPFAFSYRDYVIDAFNNDKPFNRFVLEQLAADKLGGDKRELAGLGFLTVGRRFINKIHEITDDRIDVVTRGFMGLTVTCARCHDHKYDPITMSDYYGLYGVMRSSTEPNDLPVIVDPKPTPEYLKYKKEFDKRTSALDNYYKERHRGIQDEIRTRAGDYLVYVAKTHPKHKSGAVAKSGKRGAFRRSMIETWQNHLLRAPNVDKDPVFGLWARLVKFPKKGFGPAAAKLLATPPPANPKILAALRAKKPTQLAHVAEAYGDVLEKAHRDWTAARKKNAQLKKLPDGASEQLRLALHGRTQIDFNRSKSMINQGERNKIRGLQKKINDWMLSSPASPPRAMVVNDTARPFEPRIFHRGNSRNPTDRVPRRFLRILEHVDGGKAFTDGSGRLELARAIVHPKNPLTARVIVNRVWAWHFGEGLVSTPSDYGLRGHTPSHPKLLDYLASRFMADGWSIKALHRRILNSATYRQSAMDQPKNRVQDPSNKFLWRFNRRKLDFEQMRDALLMTAGRLDLKHAGRPVELFKAPFTTRRSVYGRVDRQLLPETFRTFDFASPDASEPKRPRTTVPQQALYLMNSPFVMEQASHLARRPDLRSLATAQRIEKLYQIVFGRSASKDELALGTRFVAQPVQAKAPSPWHYGYGKFNPTGKTLTGFKPLKHFSPKGYHATAKFPDPKLHYLLLNAQGGHVGINHAHAVVRRWVSPIDGTLRIRGTLGHQSPKGDGVRATVISNRRGSLGQWTAHNKRSATPVKAWPVTRGEIIDFVVDCAKEHSFDSFTWAPKIEQIHQGNVTAAWSAEHQFSPPAGATQPVDAWVVYAQALLQSNGFLFVD